MLTILVKTIAYFFCLVADVHTLVYIHTYLLTFSFGGMFSRALTHLHAILSLYSQPDSVANHVTDRSITGSDRRALMRLSTETGRV